jgi:LmbE family N-acetylglucosaminyl deacetylase
MVFVGYAGDPMTFARALVVFAHPDDAEFLAGGTIARWAGEGSDVHYLCATDGSAGWNGPDRDRAEIARIREGELREAAAVLGVKELSFLGYPDGSLTPSLDLRRDVTRVVRRVRPDVILAPDPSLLWSGRSYINHPDHRAIGEVVLAVVACDAPTRPQFPELLGEGLDPFEVPALWLATGDRTGDLKVDIGDTLEVKVRALKVHHSQIENMGSFDVEARMREWGQKVAGDADMEFAEAFRTFHLREEQGE